MSGYPVLMHTALDATDSRGLAEFYRQFLGLRYRPGDEMPTDGRDDDAGWLVLLDSAGHRVFAFQQVPSLARPTWPTARSALARPSPMKASSRCSSGEGSAEGNSERGGECSSEARSRGARDAARHHARDDGLEQRIELGLGGDRAVGCREDLREQESDPGLDGRGQNRVAGRDQLEHGALVGGQGRGVGMGQVPFVVGSGGNTWTQPILSWYWRNSAPHRYWRPQPGRFRAYHAAA